MGSLNNCRTFANKGAGVSIIGTAAHPINGARLYGGFFGNDGAGVTPKNNEITLDTFSRDHILTPDFCEMGKPAASLLSCSMGLWDGVTLNAINGGCACRWQKQHFHL